MRGLTTPAVGYEHTRGRLKGITPLIPFASFLQHKHPESGHCCPDPALTCIRTNVKTDLQKLFELPCFVPHTIQTDGEI